MDFEIFHFRRCQSRQDQPRFYSTAAALLLLALATSSTNAQIIVDAGPDQFVTGGGTYSLEAMVDGLSPIDMMIADGDGAYENYVVRYSSVAGYTYAGPLKAPNGNFFGWPSDLVRVPGYGIYGIETFHQRLYRLNPLTGLTTPVGPPTGYARLSSLAYDSVYDRFYSVDFEPTSGDRLIAISRTLGVATPLWSNLPLNDIHGLEFDPTSGLLYAYDATLNEIHTIDPTTGTTSYVTTPVNDLAGFYDELTLYRGQMYAPYEYSSGGANNAQVRRIDLTTGAVDDVGPAFIGASAHSLLINSLPENGLWSLESGPGGVIFSDASSVLSSITVSEPGEYILRYTVFGDSGDIFDSMVLEVESEGLFAPEGFTIVHAIPEANGLMLLSGLCIAGILSRVLRLR